MEFEVPDRIRNASPNAVRLAEIRAEFVKNIVPVIPRPSNAVLMTICLCVFIVLAILLAIPVGFNGFLKLTTLAAAIEYSVVLLLALALAGGATEQMIPGSRRVVQPVASLVLAVILLTVMASLLFPDFEIHDFVNQGIPCLRLGTVCAIPAAVLVRLMMKRGFVTDPVPAAIAGGALAGLLGIGVLALHCPIFNAAHIIAWHVSVILITSITGAVIGWFLARPR